MLTQELKIKYTPMKDEFFQLLICSYCYNLKISKLAERIPSNSREFLLEEATSIRSMANEIVLHLCILDDDSSSFSFRSAAKEVNRLPIVQSKKSHLNELLKNYRSNIGNIKNKHRNQYIAHRNSNDYSELLCFPSLEENFQNLINFAYEVLNEFWSDGISFNFKLGSEEKPIDLIKELGLKVK